MEYQTPIYEASGGAASPRGIPIIPVWAAGAIAWIVAAVHVVIVGTIAVDAAVAAANVLGFANWIG